MGGRRFTHSWSSFLAVFAMAALPGSTARAASSYQVIYSFAGDEDGEYPDTNLAVDVSGNLYGTTVLGGEFGSGTVFELSRSSTGWIHKVLYSFTGRSDGGEPYKGVALDDFGNLYGTAVVGGLYTGPCIDNGCGVVFKLTKSGGTWTQTVIHSFTGGSDGYGPGAGVTVGRHGNILGTTPTGGANGAGIVFELEPSGNRVWTENIIHTFTGGLDGAGGSAGGFIIEDNGTITGICTTGGAYGAGTVYQLTPELTGKWSLLTLYAFKGEPNSGFPYGSLIQDRRGNVYGTTYYAGADDLGTVYRLNERTPSLFETQLYSFKGGADGSGPISNLTAAADGSLYGTTSEGGAACGCGIIFRLTPSGADMTYSVVYRFRGAPDGAFAYNGMTSDYTGTSLYGATVHGGTFNEGAIYKFTP